MKSEDQVTIQLKGKEDLDSYHKLQMSLGRKPPLRITNPRAPGYAYVDGSEEIVFYKIGFWK